MRRRTEAGYAELISLLIAATVALVLLATFLPDVMVANRVAQENSAAQWLATNAASETAYSQLYGEYVPLANLYGTPALPITCSNPEVATSGMQVQAPAGYTLAMSMSGSATLCAGVAGFTGYTLALTPIDGLEAQRNFLLSSTDGVIHYAENRPATVADPIFATAAPIAGQVSTILTVNSIGSGSSTPVAPGGGYNVTATFTAPFGSYTPISGWVSVSPYNGQITGSGLSSGTFSGTLGQSGNSSVYVSSWGQTFSGMANFSGRNFTFVGTFTTDQKYTLTIIGVPQ